jgi:hypothetical protein
VKVYQSLIVRIKEGERKTNKKKYISKKMQKKKQKKRKFWEKKRQKASLIPIIASKAI